MTTRSLDYTSPSGHLPPDLPEPADILGRAGGENFRVASFVLPAPVRRDLMAFYGYSRLVDQLGDDYPGDRLAALDWLAAETARALDGHEDTHPLVGPAARSVKRLGADPAALFDLIEANRLDQQVSAYETFEDLLGYCRLSANPVGRLVLFAFGCADAESLGLSDAICTGLQLAEHWQDVAEDATAGRVYLPGEDLRRFGVDPADLRGPGPADARLRALMSFEVARARRWLDAGRPLVRRVPGRLTWAVAGFWAGGQAALDRVAARDFDVLRPAGRPSAGRLVTRTVAAVLSSGSRRGTR